MIAYDDARPQLAAHRARIEALHQEIRQLQAKVEPQAVQDYVFQTPAGPVALSVLFGDKDDLLVVHNMGKRCGACTLWADGFNGVYPQLSSSTAFALSSPDAPEIQAQFAAARGWRFPMVSHAGTSFAADMGYYDPKDGHMPGVSAFQRQAGQIVRLTDTEFGPGDDFCAVFPLLDLFPKRAAGFRFG